MRVLSVLVLAAVSLLGAVAAGDPPTTTTTTVAEESCDGGDLVLPEHDACDVQLTSVSAPDTAPTLEVRLRTAAADSGVPTGALLVWSSGDCAFVVDHDSGTAAVAANAQLHVMCGDVERSCTGDPVGIEVDCTYSHDDQTVVDVEPAVRDGDEFVATFTFDGALAEWADLHDAGATLGWGIGAVGPRVSADESVGYTIAAFTCGTDTPCFDFGGDFIAGDRAHTVG